MEIGNAVTTVNNANLLIVIKWWALWPRSHLDSVAPLILGKFIATKVGNVMQCYSNTEEV